MFFCLCFQHQHSLTTSVQFLPYFGFLLVGLFWMFSSECIIITYGKDFESPTKAILLLLKVELQNFSLFKRQEKNRCFCNISWLFIIGICTDVENILYRGRTWLGPDVAHRPLVWETWFGSAVSDEGLEVQREDVISPEVVWHLITDCRVGMMYLTLNSESLLLK